MVEEVDDAVPVLSLLYENVYVGASDAGSHLANEK